MALFRRRKMRKETASQQKYLKYYNQMRRGGRLRQALTYSQWKKPKGFRTVRTKSIEKSLRRAGLTEKEIQKLRGKR